MPITTGAKVETYQLTAPNGRHIRIATRVILASGEAIAFTERMTKRDALRNAELEFLGDK